jgi:uncharacterized protein (DUF2267 family)
MNSSSRTRRLGAAAFIGAFALTAMTATSRRTDRESARDWMRHLGDRVKRPIARRRGSILRELREEASDDVVLADRVRSSLGPLLKELDTPHIHVMAEGNRVLLHGEVVDGAARAQIEAAVRKIAGVGTVATYLKVGLFVGEDRPSRGHQDIPSRANRAFHDALSHVGLSGRPAELALIETLQLFTDATPEGERAHLFAHLPVDVRSLLKTNSCGCPSEPVADVADFVARVRSESGLKLSEARLAVNTVIRELLVLVPEECDDIAAVLPPGLREVWKPADAR